MRTKPDLHEPHSAKADKLPSFRVTQEGWLVRVPRHTGLASGSRFPDRGSLLHFQAGCGDPYSTLKIRGVSAHLSVQRTARPIQYESFRRQTFHAYDAADHYAGFETAVLPRSCDMTVDMLEALAAIVAAHLDWLEAETGRRAPTRRVPGAPIGPRGIKCHADGLAPGASWNPARHWDAPWKAEGDPISRWVSAAQAQSLDRSPWTSRRFLRVVDGLRSP